MMKRALLLLPLLWFVGCASAPADRIARHQAEFALLPAETQALVRAGRVDIGFSEIAVTLALGEPLRRFEKRESAGVTSVWVYGRSGPTFSFGVGVGVGGRHSAGGIGVDTTLPSTGDDEALRIEFQQGKVVKLEYRKQ